MTIRTVYTCDICEDEVPKDDYVAIEFIGKRREVVEGGGLKKGGVYGVKDEIDCGACPSCYDGVRKVVEFILTEEYDLDDLTLSRPVRDVMSDLHSRFGYP